MPADLLHFKALTIGKPVIMGRKTFASMRRPLKLRRNIVLTRDASFYAEGIEVAHRVDEVLELTQNSGEIAVIGGAEIFTLFSPYVDSIYATEIDAEISGDVHFSFPQRECIRIEGADHAADERNPYRFRYVRYDFTARTVT